MTEQSANHPADICRTHGVQAREFSSMSGIFIEESLAVNVLIYRESKDSPWQLELRDDTIHPVCFSKTFTTPNEAWNEFMHLVRSEGMASVAGAIKTRTR